MNNRIAVIGKSGQLAWELAKLNNSGENGTENTTIICFGRNELDITNIAAIDALFKKQKITAVINASAYTAVDLAEKEQEQADLINHQAVSNLAQVCNELSLPLVHVSTDYVFAGDKGSPYLSNDVINPQGVYGKTKADGEQAIMNIHPKQSTILRTSWVYSVHGNNFVKTMLRLMEEKEELGIIDDQIGSPTWAKTLAVACIYAIENKLNGIYHWTDEGVASWYDFAQAIQTTGLQKGLITKKIAINPIASSAYATPAKRPHYSVLGKVKTREAFKNLANQHWATQLNDMLEQLKNHNALF